MRRRMGCRTAPGRQKEEEVMNATNGSAITVTAAVLREVKGSFTIEELELDELRPNEARVRVVAVGVCHTDMVMRDGVYPIPMPVVLGHEAGGVVEAVGRDVRRVAVGDRVGLSSAYCGRSARCLMGQGAYCENLFAEDFGGRRTFDGTSSLKTRSHEV